MEDNNLLIIHGGNEKIRAFAAMKIIQKYIPKTLLLSGGIRRGKYGRTEAEILKRKIFSKNNDNLEDIEKINVILEEKSVDTRENVKNTIKKIGNKIDKYSKIVFLTSFHHAKRVKIVFRKELTKFCRKKGFDNEFKEEIIGKTEFINAEDIINKRSLWTKDERIEHREFFKKVKILSKEWKFKRKEKFLRTITILPFGLRFLNHLSKKDINKPYVKPN